MDKAGSRIDLETRLSNLLKGYEGKPINQEFITSIWAATFDEIMFFNETYFNFSRVAVNWLHSYYVNNVIKISTQNGNLTIGQLSSQKESPEIGKIMYLELFKMRQLFQSTHIENVINEELNRREKESQNNEKSRN